jgi:hypothetical protein
LQNKAKRRFLKFVGFIGVISIVSGGTTGYFFHRRMKHVLQDYGFMIKSEGLMLKERGAQLKGLGGVISSYAKSEGGFKSEAYKRRVLQKYANEVQKHGEELEQYGGQLISDIQAKQPEDALATIADVKLFIPENLDTIKEQQKEIQKLEISAMTLKNQIQELQIKLYYCRSVPKAPSVYPPDSYHSNAPQDIGSDQQNHPKEAK